MRAQNYTTLQNDNFDQIDALPTVQQRKQKVSSQIFVGIIILFIVSIIGLAVLLANYSNISNLNYPTDSFGNICYNLQKTGTDKISFPYVYLNIQNNKVVRYCISSCPTKDSTFNNENIYVYRNQGQQQQFQYLKNKHHYYSLQEQAHTHKHKKEVLVKDNSNLYKNGQEPSLKLGGVCLSEAKLTKIEQVDVGLYLQIQQKFLIQKFLVGSFIIVLAILVLSTLFNLMTKTNMLVNTQNDPTYYNLDRTSVRHSMDFLMIMIFAIMGLLLTFMIGLSIVVSGSFDNFSQTQERSSELIKSQAQLIVLICVVVISIILVSYLFYNLLVRSSNSITLTTRFVRYGEQYIKKHEYVFFSLSAGLFTMLILAILVAIWLTFVSHQKQEYQKDRLFLQTSQSNYSPLIYLFLGFTYFIFNLLEQFYLYAVTYKAYSVLLKRQKNVSFMTCRDIGFIFKIAVTFTFLSFPIKLISSLNLNFEQNPANPSCLVIFYRKLFCLCGWMINRFHQLGLNNYLLYIPEKFQMLKIYPNPELVRQDQEPSYGRYMHYIYHQVYKQHQRSSLYVYQISELILKGIFALITSFIMQYSLNNQSQDQSKYVISFSMVILTTFLACEVSNFSSSFIFANTSVVQLKTILLRSNLIRQQNHNK